MRPRPYEANNWRTRQASRPSRAMRACHGFMNAKCNAAQSERGTHSVPSVAHRRSGTSREPFPCGGNPSWLDTGLVLIPGTKTVRCTPDHVHGGTGGIAAPEQRSFRNTCLPQGQMELMQQATGKRGAGAERKARLCRMDHSPLRRVSSSSTPYHLHIPPTTYCALMTSSFSLTSLTIR